MNNNPNKYDDITVKIAKVIFTLLVCISIAILIKFGIEINNIVKYSKDINNLKQKTNIIQQEYIEIHNKVEEELKYEY